MGKKWLVALCVVSAALVLSGAGVSAKKKSSSSKKAAAAAEEVLAAGAPVSADMTAAQRDAAAGGPVGYGLMMDAGSTGSRVHVYRWVWKDGDKLPNITDDFFHQVKPGLSSLMKDGKAAAAKDAELHALPDIQLRTAAQQAAASLQALLDYALTVMPASAVTDTWVRLYATAGLRLLPQEDQEAILEAVRDVLQRSPFVFQRDWVDIASGTFEAVDAWVTANYILGGATAESATETVGTIDLGGGSMQVAARIHRDDHIAASARFDLSLAGQTRPLFALSFLAYGLMEVRKRVDLIFEVKARGLALASPARHGDSVSPIVHPCLLRDDFLTLVDMPGVRIKGSGDWPTCLAYMRMLSGNCQHLSADECLPLTQEHDATPVAGAPPFSGKYLAFSYFYDVLPEFVRTHEPTVSSIRSACIQVCNKTLSEVQAEHPDYEPQNPEFARRACLDLTYILHVLQDYLKFSETDARIELVKQVNGKEMSWTLGATLRMLKQPQPKPEL